VHLFKGADVGLPFSLWGHLSPIYPLLNNYLELCNKYCNLPGTSQV